MRTALIQIEIEIEIEISSAHSGLTLLGSRTQVTTSGTRGALNETE